MRSGNPIITSVVSNFQPRSFFVQGEAVRKQHARKVLKEV
jgi:hypothetical protein